MGDRTELINELEDAKCDIEEALHRAEQVLRDIGGSAESRAKSYWLAHIRCQLDHNHSYLSREMCTIQDTIDELRG